MNPHRCLLAALALLTLTPMPALSADRVTYVYYSVAGRTLPQIQRALIAAGPHVGDSLAYATTSAHTSQSGALRIGPTCQFASYHLSISFRTKLPRLANPQALSSADRSRWQSFMTFVAAHEAVHRSIWKKCASRLEATLRGLRAPDCISLTRKAYDLAGTLGKSCQAQHQAFDAQQQVALRRQPFIQSLLRQARK